MRGLEKNYMKRGQTACRLHDGHRDSMKESAKGRFFEKLDGVGPDDNRPSPDKLHHFVKKKIRKKK